MLGWMSGRREREREGGGSEGGARGVEGAAHARTRKYEGTCKCNGAEECARASPAYFFSFDLHVAFPSSPRHVARDIFISLFINDQSIGRVPVCVPTEPIRFALASWTRIGPRVAYFVVPRSQVSALTR
jgi:hypothetical protein